MKGIIFASVFLFAITAAAQERIEMRGGLILTRCETPTETTIECSAPETFAQEIVIDLSTQHSQHPTGFHRIRTESDGIVFDAVIEVKKMNSGGKARYFVSNWLTTLQGGATPSKKSDFLGIASVRDMSALNDIYWEGGTTHRGKVSVSAMLFIGAKKDEHGN